MMDKDDERRARRLMREQDGYVHNFPVRQSFTAVLYLPKDLTLAEAARLGALLRTLAVDYTPVQPGGEE